MSQAEEQQWSCQGGSLEELGIWRWRGRGIAELRGQDAVSIPFTSVHCSLRAAISCPLN